MSALTVYFGTLLACLVGPVFIPASGWTRGLASVRNWHIVMTTGFLVYCLARRQNLRILLSGWQAPAWLMPVVYVAGLFAFCSSALLHFWAFRINGIDFSTFDLMLWNSWHGRFMESPMIGGNHFAVHLSWIMLPLVPLHAVFQSPLFLVLLHALVAWSALFPLQRLSRRFLTDDAAVILLLIVYLTHARVGSLINHGFHFEVFYLPVGFWLIDAWLTARHRSFIGWALVFLAIKEDAGLYLAGLGCGSFFFEPNSRFKAGLLTMIGLGAFACSVAVILPMFRGIGQGKPQYMSFWGHYGSSIPSILVGMLIKPQQVLRDILTSGWLELCASFLFLPLLSQRGLMACIPAVFLLGTSASPQMHAYHGYYPSALLPFFILAVLEGAARIGKHRNIVYLGLLTAPLIGGDYLRFPSPRPRQRQALHTALSEMTKRSAPVCAQTIYFPHLPYGLEAYPFVPQCLSDPERFVLLNLSLDTFPYTPGQLTAYLQDIPQHQRHDYDDGLIVVAPQMAF